MLHSPQQGEALDAFTVWYRRVRKDRTALLEKPFWYLGGYAGTGKTTLAKEATNEATRVGYGAFTGKAASVLRSKGCPGATTIHKLIYTTHDGDDTALRAQYARLEGLHLERKNLPADAPEEAGRELDRQIATLQRTITQEQKKGSRMAFRLNPASDVSGLDLLVIDECSMVDDRIGNDLLSFRVPILVLGDPAQLPPVGGAGFFTRHDPDYLLTEIHRQAEDNPILHLATLVRKRQRIEVGRYGSSRVLPRGHADCRELALGADQLICGRNKTRHANNDKIRDALGRKRPTPVEGDRLVCLRNDHEAGLSNGSMWRVVSSYPDDDRMRVDLIIRSEEGSPEEIAVEAHLHHFLGREHELTPWAKRDAQEFDYGYAITCHKAQGSQWPSVYVDDESASFSNDWWRWQYTAITRASETVTVMQR